MITWNTDNLSPETIDDILGAGTTADFLADSNREGARLYALCRSHGMREANEREMWAAYASLAKILA